MGNCLSLNGQTDDPILRKSGRHTSVNPYAKKASIVEFLEFESKRDAALALMPNRVVTPGATIQSCSHSERGLKGINQDTAIVWESFLSDGSATLAAVIDGHGPFGHMISRRVRDSLPTLISSSWHSLIDKCLFQPEPPEAPPALKSEDSNVAISMEDKRGIWRKALVESFSAMDDEVQMHPQIDPETSGAAMAMAIKHGTELIVAHIGDCRCILASEIEGQLTAVQLTVDHKCSHPKERERIRQARGRVFALDDEPHVMRVWLPYQMRPGLAMSRAFGDVVLKSHGVTAMPDVSHRKLSQADKFLVIASDGIWDVLTNEEAVRIVSRARNPLLAAELLVETAKVEWSAQFPHSRRDDCTAAVLYLWDQPDEPEEGEIVPGEAEEAPEELEGAPEEAEEVADEDSNRSSPPLEITSDEWTASDVSPGDTLHRGGGEAWKALNCRST